MTRVLIVEESPTQARQLQFILESEGFEVEVAPDGPKGLERFDTMPFDVVLCDVVMPGLSGYELCRKIKTESTRSDVPVILLTALNEPTDIIEGLLCGADNFVPKPYEPEDLVGRVQNVLANKAMRAERRVNLGVEIQFMGKRLTINSDKQQILDLLISAVEEVHRTRQRECDLRLLEEKQRLEVVTSRAREEVTRRDREELRAIVETIPTAVAIVCRDGEIHFANRNFFGVSGHGPRKTLIEWVAGVHAHAQFGQGLMHHLAEALKQTGRPVRLEATFRRHDGRQLHWLLHLQRLRAEIDGKPAVMVAGIDVTDQKRLIVQLSNARSQMEDFLAAAAHDLKAPLITISHNVNFARMSLGAAISPDASKCLDRVQSAAKDMLTLLGQVSDVSNAGRDTEPRLKHSSRELVRAALRQLDGTLVQRQAKVTVSDNMPELSCQGTKLIQVFSNLISNAVKYTPAERTPIIEVGHREGPGHEHTFFVRDNGLGVPAGSRDEIFELFRRLSTDPNVDGQGVGLTIVKRIVELHGGRAWVESTPDDGSTFYFTIARGLLENGKEPSTMTPDLSGAAGPVASAVATSNVL